MSATSTAEDLAQPVVAHRRDDEDALSDEAAVDSDLLVAGVDEQVGVSLGLQTAGSSTLRARSSGELASVVTRLLEKEVPHSSSVIVLDLAGGDSLTYISIKRQHAKPSRFAGSGRRAWWRKCLRR